MEQETECLCGDVCRSYLEYAAHLRSERHFLFELYRKQLIDHATYEDKWTQWRCAVAKMSASTKK